MAEYGVTKTGYIPKRADEIKESINQKLRDGWGYDVSINPQSVIQVLVTGIADEIAELWEMGQEKYYSLYPSSAEGLSLDNAMQFGGISRPSDRRTVYSLKCTGNDITTIPPGTQVVSSTQPQKTFQTYMEQEISHNAFREILLSLYAGGDYYALTINGESFAYTMKKEDTVEDVLDYFAEEIDISGITVQKTEDMQMRISDNAGMSSNVLVVSENILVVECVSNILFESVDYGAVVIPDGLINQIYSNVSGLYRVENDIAPVLGRLEATDIEARQEYIRRSMTRSTNMLESIRSAVYEIQNVKAVKVYENDQDTQDEYGRPGHCVEVIVDGGTDADIAEAIYNKKTSGIYAFGTVRHAIADKEGNIHDMGFNRPDPLYVWLRVVLTPMYGTSLPASYAAAAQSIILEGTKDCGIGEFITLQRLYTPIYQTIPNVANISITAYLSKSASSQPEEKDYIHSNVELDIRDKAVFDKGRIEVVVA